MAQLWRNSSGITVATMSATGIMTAKTFSGRFVGDGSGLITPVGKFSTTQMGTTAVITLSTLTFGETYVSTRDDNDSTTYNLPAINDDDWGGQFIFVKLGRSPMIIHAADGDKIADSTSGGNIYNNAIAPAIATITLRVVSGSQWMIFYGDGAWVTN